MSSQFSSNRKIHKRMLVRISPRSPEPSSYDDKILTLNGSEVKSASLELTLKEPWLGPRPAKIALIFDIITFTIIIKNF